MLLLISSLWYVAETIVYDPNFQYGRFDKYVDKWKGLLALYNKEMKGAKKEEQGRIIAKYQQVLQFPSSWWWV